MHTDTYLMKEEDQIQRGKTQFKAEFDIMLEFSIIKLVEES